MRYQAMKRHGGKKFYRTESQRKVNKLKET